MGSCDIGRCFDYAVSISVFGEYERTQPAHSVFIIHVNRIDVDADQRL